MTPEKQEILDLAYRIENLQSYSGDEMGIELIKDDQPVPNHLRCLLINEKWRDTIVRALRALP